MPTQFIAEVSSNHHRDLDRCLAFIDVAAHIGCSAVKFQSQKIDPRSDRLKSFHEAPA